MKKMIVSTLILGFFIAGSPLAHANVKQLKTYREVYPDYKPNCVYCHIDEKPKKEDGKHELNAYGLKLQELMAGAELTADIVQSVGKHEDFKVEEAVPVAEEAAGTEEGAGAEEALPAAETTEEK